MNGQDRGATHQIQFSPEDDAPNSTDKRPLRADQVLMAAFLESCGRKASRWALRSRQVVTAWSRAFLFPVRVGRLILLMRLEVSVARVIDQPEPANTAWRKD